MLTAQGLAQSIIDKLLLTTGPDRLAFMRALSEGIAEYIVGNIELHYSWDGIYVNGGIYDHDPVTEIFPIVSFSGFIDYEEGYFPEFLQAVNVYMNAAMIEAPDFSLNLKLNPDMAVVIARPSIDMDEKDGMKLCRDVWDQMAADIIASLQVTQLGNGTHGIYSGVATLITFQ